MEQILTIIGLSPKGSGFAMLEDKKTFVPYTVPGDQIRAKISPQQDKTFQGEMIELLKASPQRTLPICPHFTKCGSCLLQHLRPDVYQHHKIQKVKTALYNQGFEDPHLKELIVLPSRTRRRANFKIVKTQQGVSLGYYQRNSHYIVDIQQCAVVIPEIENIIPALRSFLNEILDVKQKAEIYITSTGSGLDILFKVEQNFELSMNLREKFVDFARLYKLSRLSVGCGNFEEPIITFNTPTVEFSGIQVEIDARGFLQASQLADKVLSEVVSSYLPQDFTRAADLFCGRGTFTFLLAKYAKVYAAEMDTSALTALKKAAILHQKSIQTEHRNLFSSPLLPIELNKYQVILINPPRIGAAKQAKQIALSQVPCIIMISCNPTTFARDARILKEGGYQLDSLTPVDQFLWSEHIELVGCFKKA
ncbi:MAG: 23S rRNA (uracil(1939)-C(5))-methyltransferase RlmD [Alphaproteobacteria bacterium]|nr:23S rRNA (uracil(1939)-C(5))-methyltransferase RlmD [Alphaproteobacteria bacterium]